MNFELISGSLLSLSDIDFSNEKVRGSELQRRQFKGRVDDRAWEEYPTTQI